MDGMVVDEKMEGENEQQNARIKMRVQSDHKGPLHPSKDLCTVFEIFALTMSLSPQSLGLGWRHVFAMSR